MADQIRVHTEQMQELAGQMGRLASALEDIEGQVRGIHLERISGSEVKVTLPSGMLGSIDRKFRSGEAKDCLKSLSGIAGEMSRYTHAVAGSIGMAADEFETTERMLVNRFGMLNSGQGSLFAGVCEVLNYHSDRGKWTPEMHKKFQDMISKGQLVVDGGMALLMHGGKNYLFGPGGLMATYEEKTGVTGVTHTGKLHVGNSLLEAQTQFGFLSTGGKYNNDVIKQEKIEDIKMYVDENGDLVEDKDRKKRGEKVEMLMIGASGSQSVSVWHEEGFVGNEHGSAEGSVDLLTGEMHGSVTGGLGVYLPGKDGKSELYLGVDAEAGASVSALEIEGSARYELLDAVEVSAEGDVSMLTAGAYLAGGLGVVGGEFMAYAKGGAEANLVELNGDLGVDVAGIKGTVGGGVQVGIGASAEAGYKDGKIVLDASVSLGVGVSVNVELDIGGFVDNVGDALQSLKDGICAWWG